MNVRCKRCGKENPKGAVFCKSCGNKLEEPDPLEKKRREVETLQMEVRSLQESLWKKQNGNGQKAGTLEETVGRLQMEKAQLLNRLMQRLGK